MRLPISGGGLRPFAIRNKLDATITGPVSRPEVVNLPNGCVGTRWLSNLRGADGIPVLDNAVSARSPHLWWKPDLSIGINPHACAFNPLVRPPRIQPMQAQNPKLEDNSHGFNPSILLSTLLCLLTLLYLYNAFFHPLAQIPGPFFAKLTDLWHAYHLNAGRRHELLYALHQKFGPLVRIGPDTVSVDTVEGLQKVYSATSPTDKSPFYKAFAPGFKSSFASTGAVYKEKKSILSQAFSQKKLDAMEGRFKEHTKELLEVMKTQKEVDLDDCLSALTIDILSDVCFGESFELLRNPDEKREISEGLARAAQFVSLEGTLWRWPFLQRIIRKLSMRHTTRGYPAQRAIRAMIKQRQQPSGREDIFNYLLKATQPGSTQPFPDNELFGEAIIMFVAGSDTTSTALLTILWYLMRHREVYDALASEIRSNFTDINEISYQKAQHLPYLRAVIDEGLRLYPPNSGFIPRQVIESDRPFVLHNIVFPVGTEIGVANMALHRNPSYFESPDEFIPERWTDGHKAMIRDKNAFSPFSKGPRACLGRTMAYMEMSLALATLFLELDMEFKYPEAEADRGYTATDAFVLLRPKVRVVAEPRRGIE